MFLQQFPGLLFGFEALPRWTYFGLPRFQGSPILKKCDPGFLIIPLQVWESSKTRSCANDRVLRDDRKHAPSFHSPSASVSMRAKSCKISIDPSQWPDGSYPHSTRWHKGPGFACFWQVFEPTVHQCLRVSKNLPKSSPPNALLCTSQPDQTRAKKAHANTWNWPCKTNWPGMVPTKP